MMRSRVENGLRNMFFDSFRIVGGALSGPGILTVCKNANERILDHMILIYTSIAAHSCETKALLVADSAYTVVYSPFHAGAIHRHCLHPDRQSSAIQCLVLAAGM